LRKREREKHDYSKVPKVPKLPTDVKVPKLPTDVKVPKVPSNEYFFDSVPDYFDY